MTATRLSLIRIVMIGATGLLCLLYAVLALITGSATPLPIWSTGLAGVVSAAIIWGAAICAGRCAADQAFDEGYRADARNAQAFGFWVAVSLYPLFSLLLWQKLVTWPVAFAAMGCLTAAGYLLCLIVLDIRGRS